MVPLRWVDDAIHRIGMKIFLDVDGERVEHGDVRHGAFDPVYAYTSAQKASRSGRRAGTAPPLTEEGGSDPYTYTLRRRPVYEYVYRNAEYVYGTHGTAGGPPAFPATSPPFAVVRV